MFKAILATTASLAIGLAAQAAVVNVNITSGNGSNPNATLDGTASAAGLSPIAYTGTTWNDLGSVSSADLNDSDGNATGIGVSVTNNGGNAGPGFTFSQGGGSTPLINNYLAAHNGFGPALAAPLTITFTGLNPLFTYDFYFVSQGDTAGQGGTFQIGAETLQTSGADPAGALVDGSSFVSFSGISSAGDGTLDLSFSAGPGNAGFAVLNGFQVFEVPEPGSMALLSLGGLAILIRRRRQA